MLYRINVIPCHKPWRGTRSYYTKNVEFFQFMEQQEDSMLYEIPIWEFTHKMLENPADVDDPEYEQVESMYEALDKYSEETVEFPITINGEVTVYDE